MRVLLYATLMLMVCLPAFAVDNFNLPGSDYANYGGGSALLCRHTCAADARCQAWTWVKPTAHCWLKFRVPPLVRDPCCESGQGSNSEGSGLRAENNVNRPGADYRRLASPSWEACESSCAGERRCSAWSWVRSDGQCWLKSGGPFPVGDNNVISGVKYMPRGPVD